MQHCLIYMLTFAFLMSLISLTWSVKVVEALLIIVLLRSWACDTYSASPLNHPAVTFMWQILGIPTCLYAHAFIYEIRVLPDSQCTSCCCRRYAQITKRAERGCGVSGTELHSQWHRRNAIGIFHRCQLSVDTQSMSWPLQAAFGRSMAQPQAVQLTSQPIATGSFSFIRSTTNTIMVKSTIFEMTYLFHVNVIRTLRIDEFIEAHPPATSTWGNIDDLISNVDLQKNIFEPESIEVWATWFMSFEFS